MAAIFGGDCVGDWRLEMEGSIPVVWLVGWTTTAIFDCNDYEAVVT